MVVSGFGSVVQRLESIDQRVSQPTPTNTYEARHREQSNALLQTIHEALSENRVDATVKVINNATESKSFEEWVERESSDAVLTVVGFALVIFFAGVSSKLKEQKNRWIAIGTALFLFTGALTIAFMSSSKGRKAPVRPPRSGC
mgnify:CR=1 FL=1